MADQRQLPAIHRNAPVLLMTIAAGLVEFAITYRLLHGKMSLVYAAAGHLSVVALISLQLLHYIKSRRDLRLSLILLAFTMALGPLGPAATLLAGITTSIFARNAKPFEVWYRALFPDTDTDRDFFEMIRKQQSDPQGSIMPLVDVLTFGTHTQKQALLTLITVNFRPAFAPLLKMALNDSNNAIRVQAATGITKIENDFMRRTLMLTHKLQETPERNSERSELLKSIAQHYDEYAYAGLLDSDREEDCRENALRYYRQYLNVMPDDQTARISIGRILVRGSRYEEAVEWFEQTYLAEDTQECAVWYMESLFRSGKFEKLRSFVSGNWKKLRDGACVPLEISEAIQLWLAQNAEAHA
ncbi:MAG TPA: hypothetical protein VE422_08105 [Terriglobia bacterium]|nr:hypothetical protein [Terriglobia bacterium]